MNFNLRVKPWARNKETEWSMRFNQPISYDSVSFSVKSGYTRLLGQELLYPATPQEHHESSVKREPQFSAPEKLLRRDFLKRSPGRSYDKLCLGIIARFSSSSKMMILELTCPVW